jgi:hypothetical protein
MFSVTSIATQTPIAHLKITWPLLPEDFVLPDDPVENTISLYWRPLSDSL